jgi:RNA polymerase sigma factor (sigma-70 family)
MKFNDQSTLEELIEGCIHKDRLAQKYLYKQLYSSMFAVALRYSKDEDMATYILNNSFLKVFTKIESHNKEHSFYGWVKRIVINSALDEIRKNKKHSNQLQIEEIQEPALTENVLDKLKAEDLLKAIQTLPGLTNVVFNLYTIEGYKHHEIAKKLSIPEGTSKWHVSQGRKLLKKKLAYYLTETNRG